METRELSSEQHTESELDLGESASPGRESTSAQPRLPFGLSVRGLQGTAAVLGFVTIVSAAVIGGALAVDSVARFDGDRPDGSALLEDGNLTAVPPVPTEDDKSTKDSDPKPRKSENAGKSSPDASGNGKNSGNGSGSGSGTGGKQVDQVKSEEKAAPKTPKAAPLAPMGILHNLVTGQCADLPDSDVPAVGTVVNQYNCIPGATDNQDFELVEQFGELMIRNLKTNYCLDLPGTGSVPQGSMVVVGPCQSGPTDNQMFRAEAQARATT